MMFLSQIRDRRVWERWARAESRRVKEFLGKEDDETLGLVCNDLGIRATRCGPEEEKATGFPYKVNLAVCKGTRQYRPPCQGRLGLRC
jgi:DNA primase large subunit